MSKGLDRIARYLINEALVKVDDMPDDQVAEEVESVIASLRAKVAAGKLFAREMAVVRNMAISGVGIGAIIDSLDHAIAVFEKAEGE